MEKKEIEIIELGLRDKSWAVREAAVQAFVGRMEKLLLQGGTYEAGEGEEKVYGAVEPVNGPGSCLWAREIGEFPAAVTKKRFCGK